MAPSSSERSLLCWIGDSITAGVAVDCCLLESGRLARRLVVFFVAFAVAGWAAELELIGSGVPGLLVRWSVVVLEKLGASAVDTGPVTFADDTFLTRRRMPTTVRGVHRVAFGIVNQYPNERVGDQLGHGRLADRCAVIEGRTVAAHMDDGLEIDVAEALFE